MSFQRQRVKPFIKLKDLLLINEYNYLEYATALTNLILF